MTTVSQLEDAFQAIFGNADQIAHDTGFVQRVQKGKLTGKRFAVTQTLGLLVSGGGAMSDLAYFGTHVSPQALDQRFGETTANFLKELLNIAFTQVVAADRVAIPLLQRFSEVIVEDSSTFSLPDDLKAVWEGCGGRTYGTLSAFKIQVRWDLRCGAFKGLALQHGKTPDSQSPFKLQRRCACPGSACQTPEALASPLACCVWGHPPFYHFLVIAFLTDSRGCSQACSDYSDEG